MQHDPMRGLQTSCALQSLLDCALDRALELTGTALGNLQLMDWRNSNLSIAAQRGFNDKFLSFFRRVSPTDGSACARAVLQGRAIIIEDVLTDDEFAPYRTIALEAGFRSVQSTPLISSGGAFVGVLSTHFSKLHRPRAVDMRAMAAIAGITANAIIRRRAIGRAADPAAKDFEERHEQTSEQINRARQAVERSNELLRRIGQKLSH